MNLKELRKGINGGITQKEVAERLGINKSILNKYENGVIEPNIDTLIKLADFFNVSIDTLVGRESDMIDVRKLTDIQRNNVERLLNLTPDEDIAVKGYLDKLFEDRKRGKV